MKKTITIAILLVCALIIGLVIARVAAPAAPAPTAVPTAEPTLPPTAEPTTEPIQAPVEEESEPSAYVVNGFISAVNEDGSFIIQDENGLDILVLVNDATVSERSEPLAIGQFVVVDYNGMMTRSVPAQITALRIYGTYVEGTVAQLSGQEVLLENETLGQLIVHVPENMALPMIDEQVRVHFSGMMMLSMPGQINALAIESIPSENAR